MKKKLSYDRLRRSMTWCAQPKCIHGAEYAVLSTGKKLCKHCAGLLHKHELTRLPNQEAPQ